MSVSFPSHVRAHARVAADCVKKYRTSSFRILPRSRLLLQVVKSMREMHRMYKASRFTSRILRSRVPQIFRVIKIRRHTLSRWYYLRRRNVDVRAYQPVALHRREKHRPSPPSRTGSSLNCAKNRDHREAWTREGYT